MKTTIIFASLLLFVADSSGQSPTTKLDGFYGMAGCWEHRDDKKSVLVSEQWMKPAGTSILGIGRTVRGGKTVDYEFMRIETKPDGIYFVAKPKANAEETAFKLIRSTTGEAVFENAEHDFPQRVIYRFQGPKLVGRIEDKQDGKDLGIDFPFDRAPCL